MIELSVATFRDESRPLSVTPRRISVTDIKVYTGLGNKSWNGLIPDPGDHCCVSPVTGRSERTKRETSVYVPPGVGVIQDSGAFSDIFTKRLPFGAAFDRQVKHAERFGYLSAIEYRATYDMLIDEIWIDGERKKTRWSSSAAEFAVDQTVDAARWLNAHRAGQRLVISAQGVDATQYLRCSERLIPFMRDSDCFGFGGWCIIGKLIPQMMPVFKATIDLVVPFIAREGVHRAHVWGVMYAPALAYLLMACRDHQIELSTDSSGVSLNPVWGKWGYGSWRDPHYCRPDGLALGADRIKHVHLTVDWCAKFTDSVDYSRVTLMRRGVTERGRDTSRNVAADERIPRCVMCGELLLSQRWHARTCGDRCRKRFQRQNKTMSQNAGRGLKQLSFVE